MSSKYPNVNVDSLITINKSAKDVWSILADDYGGIGKWASGVNASEGVGNPIGGSNCSGRQCKISATGFSDTEEKILTYNKDNFILQYQLVHGLPGFVKNAINTFILTPVKDETKVNVNTIMDATGIPGMLMKGFMSRSTQKVLNHMLEELKHYIETGNVHPRKQKAIDKYQKKQKK